MAAWPGEPVSSNFSPALGRDKNGIPCAILSYATMHNSNLPAGGPLDLRLDRRLVDGRGGHGSAWSGLVRSFVETGGNMMTLTVVDTEELRAAQERAGAATSRCACAWAAGAPTSPCSAASSRTTTSAARRAGRDPAGVHRTTEANAKACSSTSIASPSTTVRASAWRSTSRAARSPAAGATARSRARPSPAHLRRGSLRPVRRLRRRLPARRAPRRGRPARAATATGAWPAAPASTGCEHGALAIKGFSRHGRRRRRRGPRVSSPSSTTPAEASR